MPNNWKTYKLEEISTSVSYGYTASASIENLGPKFLRITDIQDNFINWESVPFCKIKENDFKKNKLEIGDIVVARTGNSTGATACIKDEIDAVFASYLIRFRIDRKIANPFFIDFILRSQNWKNYVEAVKGGSAQPGANAKQFGAFELELPPIQEQKSIAQILSTIDDKIENNLAINKTLEEMAMALYKHWFVDFGPFQESEFVDSELGKIPEGWEVKKIGEVIETLGGGTPSTTIKEYWEEGNILWYSPTDLTRENSLFSFETAKKITEFGLQKSSAKLFPANSLLMSSRATIGLLTINTKEACTNQGFITMLPNERLSVYQLYFWVKQNMELILSKSNGSTFKEISKSNFRDLDILIAKDIDTYINQTRDIFEQIKNNTSENQNLIQLRDTLLPKLISGEVRLKEFRESITN